MNRREMREFLFQKRVSGLPFWGIGVSRVSAAAAAAAGASWVLVNHTANFTHDIPASIIGLLPYANANAEVLESHPGSGTGVPVLAAVFAADHFHSHDPLLRDLVRAGYTGIQNFPGSVHAHGKFKEFLDDADMGFAREEGLIRLASARDLFTSAMVADAGQAERMAQAGADMLVYHPGLDADGEHRGWNAPAREGFAAAAAAARRVNPDILLARSALPRDAWPPSPPEGGVGVHYDGNYQPIPG